MRSIIDRTGEEKTNSFGSLMKIANYRNYNDIDIYFPKYDWLGEHLQYGNFKRGNISCPYEKRVFNIGYLGEGKYNASINSKCTKHYNVWKGILERCYDPKYIKKRPTYTGCEVCPEWHSFQIFAEWADKNYYEIEGQRMALDKDILCKGNKIYSPNTCVFVPTRINSLFVKSDNKRGNCPIGVTYKKQKYVASCNINGKQKNLGCYTTPEEAFQVYKNFKEQYIKEIAEEYKNVIPQKLYKAMLRYQIEIDD